MHFSQTGTYQSNGLDIYAAQKFVISAKELDNVDKNVGAFVLKYIHFSSHHHPLGWFKLVRFRESLLNTKAQGHYFTMVNIGFQVVQTCLDSMTKAPRHALRTNSELPSLLVTKRLSAEQLLQDSLH